MVHALKKSPRAHTAQSQSHNQYRKMPLSVPLWGISYGNAPFCNTTLLPGHPSCS